LVAGASGWKNSNLFREIRAAGLTENEIRFLGYLPDEDLPFFYAGAQLFLFPSLYEGFGFPPLEAMACGTPVISSDAKCMPEALGDAAILRSPADAHGFAAAVVKILSDENLRRTLQANGIRRAQEFRWEMSVKQLLRSFEESPRKLGQGHGGWDSEVAQVAASSLPMNRTNDI
jgi:glycosyltransferase involved in cell wall biosynthesis